MYNQYIRTYNGHTRHRVKNTAIISDELPQETLTTFYHIRFTDIEDYISYLYPQ